MKSVQEHAQDFQIEMGIHDLPVPIGKLKWIARKLGYEVTTYEDAITVIESLGLSHLMSQSSFAHWDYVQQHGTIYVADDLQEDDLRYALAHELGHIMLHFSGRSGRAVQLPSNPEAKKQLEEEADEFARAILAPASVLLNIGATMPDQIEDITGVPHSESYKVYIDVNQHRNKLADKIYQDKRDRATSHNFGRLLRKYDANPYRWITRISIAVIIVLSGIVLWMLTTDYVLPSITQANAAPQHGEVSMLSSPSSMPESSVQESSAAESSATSTESAEPTPESEVQPPAQSPQTATQDTQVREPARSGGETKARDRVVTYQAPVQQAPAVQETPQETEPTYTPPVVSSKPEPVYSQPPKVVQDDGNTYYWTAGGSVYHSSPSCYHIRDKAQASGILQDALDAGKKRLCYDCPKNN